MSLQKVPIQTLHLFPVLDDLLVSLLRSLREEEWKLPTVARLWDVKDVAAHLLDGNLRGLSTSRDQYFGETPDAIPTYRDLVNYINELNLSWTKAARRISPSLLIELLAQTGKEYTAHLTSLNPFDKAIYSVAWAGETDSFNWFHIAREYTEKFLHQQQIREAVGQPGLMTPELFYPFLNIFMYAFPQAYRNVSAPVGTVIKIAVTIAAGGEWTIVKKENAWILEASTSTPAATVVLTPDIAWKLFSASMKPEEAFDKIDIMGNSELALPALGMVSIMA